MTETCARPGCTSPRPPAPAKGGVRSLYCSRRCREAVLRARQRGTVQAVASGHGVVAVPCVSMGWEPPVMARPAPPERERPGSCPGCAADLELTPRGTRAACRTCRVLQAPRRTVEAHTRRAGDRQVISRDQRDEEGRGLYGRVQELLDAIAAAVAGGGLSSEVRGRLEWYAEELREAKKNRDPGRVANLEADLAGEDLGGASDGDEDVVEAEAVYDSADEDTGPSPEALALVEHMERVLGTGPLVAIGRSAPAVPDRRNPAERFRDSVARPPRAAAGPLVRCLPPTSASLAAAPLQAVPPETAPDLDPVTAAIAAGVTDPHQLVAIARNLDPAHPYVPPVGTQVAVPRRIVPWRRRRAIAS